MRIPGLIWLLLACLWICNDAKKVEKVPGLGPSEATLVCQSKNSIDPQPDSSKTKSTDEPRSEFKGVEVKRLDPGVVTPEWVCSKENGCKDGLKKVTRGFASLFVPHLVKRGSPRLLFVHGGGWTGGSPESWGYDAFASKLAKLLDMPVLSIDYPLVPVGNFDSIIEYIGLGVRFLHDHDPVDVLLGNMSLDPAAGTAHIFVTGDSSGAASSLSAVVAQASPEGLPGANGAMISGCAPISPYINLMSDGPTYISNAYAPPQKGSGYKYYSGDIFFGYGNLNKVTRSWQKTAGLYLGNRSFRDPLANPIFANPSWFSKLVPTQIHMGMPEQLQSDAVLFAMNASTAGAAVELHLYDGMWHNFPMYESGCGGGQKVALAESSLHFIADFFTSLVKKPPVSSYSGPGMPCIVVHYEYPQRVDTAAGFRCPFAYYS